MPHGQGLDGSVLAVMSTSLRPVCLPWDGPLVPSQLNTRYFQVSEVPGPFIYPVGDTEMVRMWSLLSREFTIEKQVLHMAKSKTRQTGKYMLSLR